MNKLITIILINISIIYSQAYDSDAIVYIGGDSAGLNFYSFSEDTVYTNLYPVGLTPNSILAFNNYVFVVNSGEFGANNSLTIIPFSAFSEFEETEDLQLFQGKVKQILLSANGNAWEAAGINDSLVAVTLTQTNQCDIVNFINGEVVATFDNYVEGGPQGIASLGNNFLGVAAADWSFAGLPAGSSVRILNRNDFSENYDVLTNLNCIDVESISDSTCLALTWGSFFGDGNFGTLEYINFLTSEKIDSLVLPNDSKPNKIISLNNDSVFVRFFDQNYEFHNGILYIEDFTFSVQDTGFFSENLIGFVHDSIYIFSGVNGTEFYNFEKNFIMSVDANITANNVLIDYGTTVSVDNEMIVYSFELTQNYPNPFNPTTVINFSLPEATQVLLKIFNLLGEEVTELVNEMKAAGNYEVQFDASDLSSGVYFYSIQADNFTAVKKMILLK